MDKFIVSKWMESPDSGTLERSVMLHYFLPKLSFNLMRLDNRYQTVTDGI